MGRTRKPKSGEVQWYTNAVQQGEVDREGRYNWAKIGGEFFWKIFDGVRVIWG
jgi:hypothetical protein